MTEVLVELVALVDLSITTGTEPCAHESVTGAIGSTNRMDGLVNI